MFSHTLPQLLLLALTTLTLTPHLTNAQANTPTSTAAGATANILSAVSSASASLSSAGASQTVTSGSQTNVIPAGATASSDPGSTVCEAQQVLDRCLETTQTEFNRCKQNDYSCRCEKEGAVVQCYANCPQDQGVSNAKTLQQVYCGQASSAGTTTTGTSSSSSSSSSTSTGTDSGSMTTTITSGGSTSTSTAAGVKSTSSGAAGVRGAVSYGIAEGVVGWGALLMGVGLVV